MIGIVFAMTTEAKPFLDTIEAKAEPIDESVPTRWHRGTVAGRDVVVSINGHDGTHGVELIGTQPATLATYLTVSRYRPDVIISAGTAGGWEAHGTTVGQVLLSGDRFWFHDRRIAIPAFEHYGPGGYPGADTRALAVALGYERGEVTTGNSLDETDECRRLMAANRARAKDMEAAAVAWVAAECGVPMFAVKAITDLVDHTADTPSQFRENFDTATVALTEALVRVIEHWQPAAG